MVPPPTFHCSPCQVLMPAFFGPLKSAGIKRVAVRAFAVRAPLTRAGGEIVRRQVAAHAELAARDADDDVVLHDSGAAVMVWPISGSAFFAFQSTWPFEASSAMTCPSSVLHDDFPIGVGDAAVDEVAACDRGRRTSLALA